MELLPSEFIKKYKISKKKYYKAIKSGLSHLDMVKNIEDLLIDKSRVRKK